MKGGSRRESTESETGSERRTRWRQHGLTGPLHWLAWHLDNPHRTAVVIVIGLGIFATLLSWCGWKLALLGGWIVGASTYLLLVALVAINADPVATRRRTNPEPHAITMLSSMVISTMLSNLCFGILLNVVGRHASLHNHLLAVLCIAAILLSWLLMHAGFGRYYCQLYYAPHDRRGHPASGGRRGGFGFPGTAEPTQLDFFYLAFMIGLTYSSSDVSVINQQTRKVVLVHSLASILFYSIVVASVINLVITTL